MELDKNIFKKCSVLLLVLLLSVSAFTQNTSVTENNVTSSNNLLSTLIITVMLILAFVIWGLGKALIVISKEVINKKIKNNKILILILIVGLISISDKLFAQSTTIEVVNVVPNYGGLSSTTFYLFLSVIAIELIAIFFLTLAIKNMYLELNPEKYLSRKSKFDFTKWWNNVDAKYFTRAIPIETEKDSLLDHDYDGIKELDNSLPPWWKYGFYITIVVAFIYLMNFHVFDIGKNPQEEYAIEMQNAATEKAIYEENNKDKIDENNIVMADDAGLAKAKEIFNTDCWACHGKSGEGGAGPNLTDDYWIHKPSLNGIYNSIKNGYPDKGMQAWSVKYTPKEMSLLAGYVKSLHGIKPANAKAPQGDLIIDTTTLKTETTK